MNEIQAKERIAMLLTIAQDSESGHKDLADAGAEAIKALHTRIRLRQELQRLEQEVNRCYALANENALYRLEKEEIRWRARADAFRDLVGIVKGVLGG